MGREIIIGYRDEKNNFVDVDFICGRTDFTNRLFNFFDYRCSLDDCQVFELTNKSDTYDKFSKDVIVEKETEKVLYVSYKELLDVIKEHEEISHRDISIYEGKIDRAYKVLNNVSTLQDLLDLENYIEELQQQESDGVDYTPIYLHRYIDDINARYGNVIIIWSE